VTMLRLQRWGVLLLVPALAYLVTVVGCGGSDKPTTGNPPKKPPTIPTSTTTSEATPVEGKGLALVKGQVTLDGAPPAPEDLKPRMSETKDKDHCLKGPTLDPTWMVGADKGVANVVIWLKAPEGKYFKIPDNERTRTDLVKIEQPFCMFQPHVAAINPSDYDPATKKQKPTGQTFKAINNAPMNHNTAYKGANTFLNPGDNKNLSSGSEMEIKAKPCKDSEFGKEELLNINCDIHKWMTAKVAVFDHPYYAVTDKDGKFEIKNAPAGVELKLMYWHESMSPSDLKNAKSKAVTLKDGDNTEDLKLSR
jgi:hypothetical protein